MLRVRRDLAGGTSNSCFMTWPVVPRMKACKCVTQQERCVRQARHDSPREAAFALAPGYRSCPLRRGCELHEIGVPGVLCISFCTSMISVQVQDMGYGWVRNTCTLYLNLVGIDLQHKAAPYAFLNACPLEVPLPKKAQQARWDQLCAIHKKKKHLATYTARLFVLSNK